ncbi:recombinase family protein [Achromobacter insolitus]|uniref:recombinase family protein n=1 Tax=Achromobacter insolitus TaxID=217204 RepID=UPI001EEF499D|nr:recombinase family protein [Achromobacter insolitus]
MNPAPKKGSSVSKGHRVGYRRVSTLDQSTARQLDGIEFDIEFEDRASGKDTKRPQLEAMLRHIRAGDHVYVHSIDRLARNTADLLRLVEFITDEKQADLHFVKENLTFSGNKADPMQTLMATMLGAFAQFERSMIRERQREGIELAKARGAYRGGKAKLSDEQVQAMLARVAAGDAKAAIARDFGISRETLYQHVRARPSAGVA